MDKNLPDSFIIICRNAYLAGLHPFDTNIESTDFYKKLTFSASQHKLRNFIGNLMEGHYYINLWTAFFILDKFNPNIDEKLIGMNDDKSIVQDCIETTDSYAVDFQKQSQRENYHNWISGVKSRYKIQNTFIL